MFNFIETLQDIRRFFGAQTTKDKGDTTTTAGSSKTSIDKANDGKYNKKYRSKDSGKRKMSKVINHLVPDLMIYVEYLSCYRGATVTKWLL